MTDASILLNGLRPTTGRSSIAEAMGLVQGAIDAPNQSRLLGEQVTGAGLDNEYAKMRNQYAPDVMKTQLEAGQLGNQSTQQAMDRARAEQTLRTLSQEAFKVNGFLQSGNIPRAKVAIADRIKSMFNNGEDPSEEIALMQQLDAGNVEPVMAELKNVIDLGVKAGVFGAGGTNAQLDYFNQMTNGLPVDQQEEARLISLGLKPRAMGSSAITIAEQGLTVPVANSEAVIAGSKAGASEAAKLRQQGELKPQVEGDVAAAVESAKTGVQAGAAFDKKVRGATDANSVLDLAEPLLDTATGSYGGAAVDTAASVFGVSTEGAKSAASLKALEGALIMNMPRMEGPQSDRDTNLYRQMAAQIGDSTIPVETRKAAIKTLRDMNARYQDNPSGGQQGAQYRGTIDRSNAAPANSGTFKSKSGITFSVEP